MKFSVRIFTVIPGEVARSYESVVEADSMDTAQIQLSRKIAHDWVEIPHEKKLTLVRTSYIAATEIEQVEEPDVPVEEPIKPAEAPVTPKEEPVPVVEETIESVEEPTVLASVY
jgi:hypothetical protein